jgi:ribosome production factor 1
MILIHCPDGPVSFYRISNVIPSKKIKNHATSSDYFPELVMNNFNTRLGLRVARMFNALVPQKPEFKGRRVVTFHNQRDFVFVRHHRYEFENTKSCVLQEIGPSFTMRIEKIQIGKFDGKFGEYEWFHSAKMDTSRRKFYL